MKKVRLIWYDMTEEKVREYIEVDDNATEQDMVREAYLKYHGNPPAPCLSVEVVS